MHAAGDRSGCVSVIITLRSDFLGETQRHPALNQAISYLGVIVPAMSTEELRRAITKPAELAGHPLDEAVVNLLLKDTEGREGALPLLQFALTRVWDGLKNGVEPVKTLEQIGGVGGALADEAQRIYQTLNEQEKKIAQRVFLGLVQLGEGTSDTRRRTNINSLVSYKDEPEYVKNVIGRFAHPGVRLVTLSSIDGTETAEVTHEALFANWGQMRQWLDSSRSDMRFQRRLEEAAVYWNQNGRPNGSLWRSPDLDFLKNYKQRANNNMTPLQVEFFQASQIADNNRKLLQWLGIGGLVAGLFFVSFQWQSSEKGRIEQAALVAKGLSSADPLTSLERAINLIGQSRSPLLSFPNQSLPLSVQDSLFSAVQNSRNKNVLKGHQGTVYSVAISIDNQRIVSGGEDGTVRLWDTQGKLLAELRGHQGTVYSVAISTDNQRIVSGGSDGTVRLWDTQGKLLAELRGHQGTVYSVAISTDNQRIVSGGSDGTVRLWDTQGKLLAELRSHEGSVYSVAISTDKQRIVSGGSDGTVRLWDTQGKLLAELSGHQGFVYSVAISTNNQRIVSGGRDGTVRLWDTQGKLLAELSGHQGFVYSVAISTNNQRIVSGGRDGTVRLWDT
ncbi:WD40 repeat domain-containing protein, partial [Scytonema sp. PCC 10023]|uniref:WD40 repeat domain-containing protein n=1 Tax=Scytonema sp. PCC 10023 TaxID=1680591 RepID=UPI0039C694B0